MVVPPVDWEGLFVCLLAVAVYINTLGHGFVYDDNRAILSNPDVQASSPLINVFHNDFWGTPLSSSNSHGSYRPLCVISFRFNYWTSEFYPFTFHLTNVFLHGIASFLVLKTARILLPGKSPVFAAAVFAIHPVHVEAVAGIVGRADVLAGIFYLFSFLFYVKHVKLRDNNVISKATNKKELIVKHKTTNKKSGLSRKSAHTVFNLNTDIMRLKRMHNLVFFRDKEAVYFILFVVLAVCAALSKEPGITVIPLAICYDIILHLRSKRITGLKSCVVASASASLASFLAILLVRLYIMGVQIPSFSKADNPTAKDDSVVSRTLTFLYLPVFNFLLLVCPRWLSFDWSMDAIPRVSSVLDIRFIITASFYYILFRILKYSLGFKKTTKLKITSKPNNCKTCNNHTGEEHLPTCKVVNNNNVPLQCNCINPSNRPLTTGSTVTMCLAFIVLPFIPASNLFFYVGFVVAERVLYIPSIGFCFVVALGAHVLWNSNRVLVVSGCLLITTALGARTLQRNKDWVSEESLYRSAIHINPPKAYGNLGSILSTAGRLEEAEVALRAALEHRPNMADVHYNLGNLQIRQNKQQEAVDSYHLAIQYRPSLAAAHLNLGKVFEYLARWEEAETAYYNCWLLDVTGLKDPRAHEQSRSSCLYHLSTLCKRRTCKTETLQSLEKNVKTVEDFFNGVVTQSDQLLVPGTGFFDKDRNYFKLSAKNTTKKSEAEELFLRAVQKAPKEPAVHVSYGQLLVQLGRHSDAASAYLRAAQLAPRQYPLVMSAAIALRHAGRLTEAETLYRQARDLRPMDATSHSNLGAIYHLQGKYRLAASSYKEALRLSPGDEVTMTNLQKLRNLLSRNNR